LHDLSPDSDGLLGWLASLKDLSLSKSANKALGLLKLYTQKKKQGPCEGFCCKTCISYALFTFVWGDAFAAISRWRLMGLYVRYFEGNEKEADIC
jgi:hypothetical protein